MEAEDPHSDDRDSRRPVPAVGGEPGGGEERYGPLMLSRFLKDDGRALLLYRRAGDQDEDA